jgi:hypothetical protein
LGRLEAEDILVLAAACALPWAWGGVGFGAVRAAAAVLVSAWAIGELRREPGRHDRVSRRGWVLAAAALGAFAFLQCMPLPQAIVRVASPAAARLQAAAFRGARSGPDWLRAIEADARARVPEASPPPALPAAEVAAPAPSPPHGWTISLHPAATLEKAFWYAALLAAFVLVARRCADPDRASSYKVVLIGLGAVLALVGLANRVSAPDRLLWIRAAPFLTHPFGPYVNRNHFAGAMELLVPWAAGFAWDRFATSGRRALAEPATALSAVAASAGLVAGIAAASKIAAVLLTTSVAIVLVAGARSRARRSFAVAAVAGVLIVVAAVGLLGPLAGRYVELWEVTAGGAKMTERAVVWSKAPAMFRDYWLAGSGYGAFHAVFPIYQPAGETDQWTYAHSDWIEAALAGGCIGLALTLAVAAGFAGSVVAAIRSSWGGPRRAARLGAAAGVASLGVHAGVDFNHQIPANALLFVVIAAWVVAPALGKAGAR